MQNLTQNGSNPYILEPELQNSKKKKKKSHDFVLGNGFLDTILKTQNDRKKNR